MAKKSNTTGSARRRPPSRIIYRHLGTQAPADCTPGWCWQVEFHEGRGFPSGVAWVAAPPPDMTEPPPGWDARPRIEFVLVADDARRRGIATRLIEACRERWPDARLSLPISPAGLALYKKVRPRPAPESVFGPEFIAAQRAAGVTRRELERLALEHDDQLASGLVDLDAGGGRPGRGGTGARAATRATRGKDPPGRRR